MRAHAVAYPVGKETRLPLIQCPDCHLTRVIELRVKQDTPNKGRSFFKCPQEWGQLFCVSIPLCFFVCKSRV